jgi:hypothetical protein
MIVKQLVESSEIEMAMRPALIAYGEVTGWYAMNGPSYAGDRLRMLATATIDYWMLPNRDDIYLRVRYENGYERGTPLAAKNHVIIALGLRF